MAKLPLFSSFHLIHLDQELLNRTSGGSGQCKRDPLAVQTKELMAGQNTGTVRFVNSNAQKAFCIPHGKKNWSAVIAGDKEKVTASGFLPAVTAAGHIDGIPVIAFRRFQKVCNGLVADI